MAGNQTVFDLQVGSNKEMVCLRYTILLKTALFFLSRNHLVILRHEAPMLESNRSASAPQLATILGIILKKPLADVFKLPAPLSLVAV